MRRPDDIWARLTKTARQFILRPMDQVIRLWPNGAPGSENWHQKEQEFVFEQPWHHRILRNVAEPTLSLFLPKPSKATGVGVIVCPGGGHHLLAIDHEGYDVAAWLNERGIAAMVLKYRVIETSPAHETFMRERDDMRARLERLMPAHWPLALADGQEALRLARKHAFEWGLRPDRIGMMGFSAGAHLTVGVTLSGLTVQDRPDFIAPIYGALWGEDPKVPPDAPPLFTALASDDPIAVAPCLAIYQAWHAAGRPAEMHLYGKGQHGFGMVKQGLPVDGWIERFHEWLGTL